VPTTAIFMTPNPFPTRCALLVTGCSFLVARYPKPAPKLVVNE